MTTRAQIKKKKKERKKKEWRRERRTTLIKRTWWLFVQFLAFSHCSVIFTLVIENFIPFVLYFEIIIIRCFGIFFSTSSIRWISERIFLLRRRIARKRNGKCTWRKLCAQFSFEMKKKKKEKETFSIYAYNRKRKSVKRKMECKWILDPNGAHTHTFANERKTPSSTTHTHS